MATPFERALLARRDEPAWVPTEQGIWCPICGNLVVPPHLMHDDDIEMPDDCSDCGYPDLESVAEFHTSEGAGDGNA